MNATCRRISLRRHGRALRRVVGALPLLCTLARVANAHAIHTTLTVATVDAAGLTLNIRAFADDFSATVAQFAGRRPPVDSSAPPGDIARYVHAHLTLTDARGVAMTLQSCGTRRVAELYWLCFRAPLPLGVGGVLLGNQMLTEWHRDQVNIVQLESHGSRKTLLFTKRSAPSTIAIR